MADTNDAAATGYGEADIPTGYGEADIEAKAMTDAAGSKPKPPGKSPPSPDTVVPAAGTTEADIGKNLRQQADRASKS